MTSDSASRVTRSRSSLRRALLLFGAVLAGVTALRAQETPPAPPAAAPAPGGPAPAAGPAATGGAPPVAAEAVGGEPAAPAASPNAEAPAPSAGKPAGPVGPTRDRFEPTEKVRADFDVSFPVDI
jgi:hypothetical protein